MASLYKPPAEDEIRLLFLHPGANHNLPEQIECTRETVFLPDYRDRNGLNGIYDDAYEAVSYVWGTEPATSTIQVNGDSFAIRPNLASALQCFQQGRLTRPLWIDAICINQDDLQERTQQVALMSKIYSFANEVLIWLGPFDADMASILEHIDNWAPSKTPGIAQDNENMAWMSVLAKERILTSAWFSRVWVVQEFTVANAAIFCCGRTRMRSRQLMRFFHDRCAVVEMSTAHYPAIDPRVAEMGLLVSRSVDKSSDHALSNDFHALLATFRSRQASNPRDKTFALSGIASRLTSQKPHDLLAARYDVSVLQAYHNTARYCLEVEHSSDILCSAGLKVDDPSWPSWVPDWSVIAPPHSRLKSVTRYKTLCDDEYVSRSRKIRKQTMRPFPRGSSVRVPSRVKASAIKTNGNTLSMRGVFVGHLRRLSKHASTPPHSDALQRHFERVALVPGPYWEVFGQYGPKQLWRRDWARELAEDLLDDLACTSTHKRLGFLDNGMPVYGPSNMQTGDFVALTLGCAVPLVFRYIKPYGGSSLPRQCRLVGECYVHRLMDHEQANEQGENEWLDEVAEGFEVT